MSRGYICCNKYTPCRVSYCSRVPGVAVLVSPFSLVNKIPATCRNSSGPPPSTKEDTMKRFTILTGLLALSGQLALAQTSTWVPDKAHSEVDFSILHMSVAHVHGHFGNISGAITWNE